MKHYVLGFYFFNDQVLLIHKAKPDWQRGLYNGLGGSIEPGETIPQAMVREFLEESSIQTSKSDWQHKATLKSDKWILEVLTARREDWDEKKQSWVKTFSHTTDEGTARFYSVLPDNMEQTAYWLFFMCNDDSVKGTTLEAAL